MAARWLKTAELSPANHKRTKARIQQYWMPHFDQDPVDTITFDRILEVFVAIDKAPKTKVNILSDLSSIMTLARKSKYITENPCDDIDRPKRQKPEIDPFTRVERDRILGHLTGNALLFYTIRFYNGLRPGEVVGLQWSDISGPTALIHRQVVDGAVREVTKTHERRTVDLHPVVISALRNAPSQFKGGYVLVPSKGEASHYPGGDTLGDSLRSVLPKLGIRQRSSYNARHTCATMMLEAGMKPGYCAKQLGHSLRMFFDIYAKWIDRDESDRQAAIWAEVK